MDSKRNFKIIELVSHCLQAGHIQDVRAKADFQSSEHMSIDQDCDHGWVPVTAICQLKRIKSIKIDYDAIVSAVKSQLENPLIEVPRLQLSECGLKIRLCDTMQSYDQSCLPIFDYLVEASGFPRDTSIHEARQFFSQFGCVTSLSFGQDLQDMENNFENSASALNCLAKQSLKVSGCSIAVRPKRNPDIKAEEVREDPLLSRTRGGRRRVSYGSANLEYCEDRVLLLVVPVDADENAIQTVLTNYASVAHVSKQEASPYAYVRLKAASAQSLSELLLKEGICVLDEPVSHIRALKWEEERIYWQVASVRDALAIKTSQKDVIFLEGEDKSSSVACLMSMDKKRKASGEGARRPLKALKMRKKNRKTRGSSDKKILSDMLCTLVSLNVE